MQLLNALKDFEAAATALATQAVGRIGDGLQFMKDEPRNKERAIEEVCFADFGDAAVDQHAGVEQLSVDGNRGRARAKPQQWSQRTGLQGAKLARAEHDSHV